MRPFTKRFRLTVLLGLVGLVALGLVGRWLNATKRGRQAPAEPVRLAGESGRSFGGAKPHQAVTSSSGPRPSKCAATQAGSTAPGAASWAADGTVAKPTTVFATTGRS